MNTLISAIKDKQKIMFANEGRLLKKSFFGLLILTLAFQTGNFGNIVRQSMVDAYLAVSVFVGFTLIVFIGLDSLTKVDINSFLEKTKKLHVPIASFLGAIPGCGGAIIVVTQYIQGKLSFGSDKICQNIQSFIENIKKSKPSGSKGTFIKKISISSTMGVSLNCEVN